MIEDRSSKAPVSLNRLNGPRKPAKPSGPNSRWPQYVQFMVVVGITVLFLVLAISMQQHHFLNGEFYDRSHPADR
jgi:hypothetical protein